MSLVSTDDTEVLKTMDVQGRAEEFVLSSSYSSPVGPRSCKKQKIIFDIENDIVRPLVLDPQKVYDSTVLYNNGIPVTRISAYDLQNRKWLRDDVINFYCHYLQCQHDNTLNKVRSEENEGARRSYIFSTQIMEKILGASSSDIQRF